MNKNTMITAGAAIAVAAGLALGGAALANADGSTSTSTPTSTVTSSATKGSGTGNTGTGNTDPSKPMRSDERLLTGDTLTKVTAAVKAQEPTATIERVESDSDGVYEAHMVRTDGTHVIVQVGADFAVTGIQERGAGGPGGHDGRDGQPPAGGGQGEQAPTTSGSSATA